MMLGKDKGNFFSVPFGIEYSKINSIEVIFISSGKQVNPARFLRAV